ncbi:MAG: amidohydrolase family protein [Armatimonadota bacterium]|nr:amidohydrolase family protein [Armatimonadota bacterium]MDR7533785.1 amidohydrolase family protein [Armatimonadota bacterium]MDR7535775.1 amidohydrolase family protein [Armatimonadota bacterium]
MLTTVIKDADWVVAFDGTGHRLLRGGSVAFRGNTITYVGKGDPGPADVVIDGRGRVVIPGLIDIHAHLMTEGRNKGFLEDQGSRKLWMSGLFEYLPAMSAFDPLALVDVLRFALVELVKSGCTTVFEMGWLSADTLEVLEASGLRVFTGPLYRSARWYTRNGHEVLYEWDIEKGWRDFQAAVEFVERNSGAWSGRLVGVLCPAQADTCTPDLLRETMAAARQLGARVQIHAAQSVSEHLEMMRRWGQTPVEFLARHGVVGPQVIVGHGIFLAHHSMIRYPDHDDLGLLASTGTHVAHCPWVFGRRGLHMESFGGYLRRGVNVGLGTDTCPQDMMEEMRWAAVLSKNATNDTACPTAAETFTAATLGGARALGREDLGRLAVGAKADLVVLDGRSMPMRPLRDPIKNIVYYGASRSVEMVFVDGRQVVRDGKVIGVDEIELGERIQRAAEQALATVPERDWAARSHEALSPLSFPVWDPDGRPAR